jgi:hypothetical protein
LTNAEVKKPEKDKRIRNSQESLDKRRKDASVRRLSSSKGPMTDAQKRAQNLRVYKADLQKAKKEQVLVHYFFINPFLRIQSYILMHDNI